MRRIGSAVIVLIVLCAGLWGSPTLHLSAQADLPGMVILKIQGNVDYTRQGWTVHQPLVAGTIITTNDLLFPQNATLLVLCADGTTHEFLQSELIANAALNCPTGTSTGIVGDLAAKRRNIRRGGRQDPTIAYLIAPRATAVSTDQVELRWNAPADVDVYELAVRGGGETWESGILQSTSVVKDGIGRYAYPTQLKEQIAYTVEICATFRSGQRHCTTDADWSTGDNLAFYYVPAVQDKEKQLTASLGDAELLYAQAALLSQPVFQPESSEAIGYYGDAIALLERVESEYTSTELAGSPSVYNLLGDLYRLISLPISANRAYGRAAELAKPETEVAAHAAIGRAMTSPDADLTIELYNEALDHYQAFLSEEVFKEKLAEFCQQIGDISYDIDRCSSQS